MSDPNNPNIKSRITPQWGLYQRESFWGTNDGKYPIFNTGKLLVIRFQSSAVLVNALRPSRNRETSQGETLAGRLVGHIAHTTALLDIGANGTDQVLLLLQCWPVLDPPCKQTSLLPSSHHTPAVGRHEHTRQRNRDLRPSGGRPSGFCPYRHQPHLPPDRRALCRQGGTGAESGILPLIRRKLQHRGCRKS